MSVRYEDMIFSCLTKITRLFAVRPRSIAFADLRKTNDCCADSYSATCAPTNFDPTHLQLYSEERTRTLQSFPTEIKLTKLITVEHAFNATRRYFSRSNIEF